MSDAFHAEFAAALLCSNKSACEWLGSDIGNRFAVYRNNVLHALIEALGAAYPAIQRLVGDEFFAAVAREFIKQERERPMSLALYGAGFSEFLRSFPPAQQLAYLADVAALERSWLEALHGADAAALEAESLQTVEDLTTLSFAAHPCTRLVVSEHPIVAIWRLNRNESIPDEQVEITKIAEAALITRDHFNVSVAALDPNQARFTRELLDGRSVRAAYAKVAASDPNFDLTPLFARLLSAGAFSRILIDGEQDHEQQ